MTELSKAEYDAHWAQLCNEADEYVCRYLLWALDECSRLHGDDTAADWRCLEEAQYYLRKGSKSGSKVPYAGMIVEWWQQHVPHDWRRAMQLWQHEVANM